MRRASGRAIERAMEKTTYEDVASCWQRQRRRRVISLGSQSMIGANTLADAAAATAAVAAVAAAEVVRAGGVTLIDTVKKLLADWCAVSSSAASCERPALKQDHREKLYIRLYIHVHALLIAECKKPCKDAGSVTYEHAQHATRVQGERSTHISMRQ